MSAIPASQLPPALEPGDPIPDVGLPDLKGVLWSLRHQNLAGRPLAVLVFGGEAGPAALRQIEALAEGFPRLQAAGAGALVLGGSVAGNAAAGLDLPFPWLADPAGAFVSMLGGPAVSSRSAACALALVDPATRFAARVEPEGEARLVVLALKRIEGMAAGAGPAVTSQAPVLMLPGVLEPELCTTLIEAWRKGDRFEGGVSGANRADALTVDYGYKKRDDWVIPAGPLADRVKRRLAQRLFPAMADAFYWAPTRHEALRIGNYKAGGGFFRAHRDNRTPHTAHRRYAMTLLLNEGFEGGLLRFPEFGPTLYRGLPGAAVVFSCNLLHEVTDVTAGERLALITFFYGEAEAAELRRRAQK